MRLQHRLKSVQLLLAIRRRLLVVVSDEDAHCDRIVQQWAREDSAVSKREPPRVCARFINSHAAV